MWYSKKTRPLTSIQHRQQSFRKARDGAAFEEAVFKVREREFHWSIQPAALAYEDASWLESSATLRMAVRQWQTAFWPKKRLCATQVTAWYHQHLGTMHETGGEHGQNEGSQNKMPFIPQCPSLAQSAVAEMPGDGRPSKPTLFQRQSMRPHAELHEQL